VRAILLTVLILAAAVTVLPSASAADCVPAGGPVALCTYTGPQGTPCFYVSHGGAEAELNVICLAP
jgi:hypothetical protein